MFSVSKEHFRNAFVCVFFLFFFSPELLGVVASHSRTSCFFIRKGGWLQTNQKKKPKAIEKGANWKAGKMAEPDPVLEGGIVFFSKYFPCRITSTGSHVCSSRGGSDRDKATQQTIVFKHRVSFTPLCKIVPRETFERVNLPADWRFYCSKWSYGLIFWFNIVRLCVRAGIKCVRQHNLLQSTV